MIDPDGYSGFALAIRGTASKCSARRNHGMNSHTMYLVPWHKLPLVGTLVLASLAATGCQVDIAGQTLPSPYYMFDDVQYFPPGPEFKLTNEAAAMKAYKAERELNE